MGPGTGIAPFVAFIEHRREQLQREYGESKELSSNIYCFTGAKYRSDMIYLENIEHSWVQQGAGKFPVNMTVALSQEGAKQRANVVMQEKETAKKIVSMLVDEGGYYYCCGDGRMADDANKALIDMISSVQQISRINATNVIRKMREEGRYQLDVWGIMNFFQEGNHLSY
jgi:sulfite reductase alpha subunit-like flavoprotein